MSTVQPTPEQVELFLQFAPAALGRTAITFLRGSNNDIERAVQEYFTDPNPKRFETQIIQGQYSENQWSAGRGESTWNEPPAFNFQDEDRQEGPQFGPLTAPTRPSSPAKQPWISTHHSSYDDDVAAAMANSLQDLRGQTNGVIDEWGGDEIVPDPPAIDRKRAPHEPALLKPLPSHDLLPAAITILSTFPLFRRKILEWTPFLQDYGYSDQWWEGEATQVPQVFDSQQMSGLATEQEAFSPPEHRVAQELQRLCAFLSQTERSYGSAGALYTLLRSFGQTDGDLHTDIFKYLELLEGDSQQSVVVSKSAEEHGDRLFHSFVITSTDTPWKHGEASLYDGFDKLFWHTSQSWGNDPQVYWFEDFTPFFMVQLHSPHAVDVPLTLYMDRYLTASKGVISDTSDLIRMKQSQIEEINDAILQNNTYISPTGKEVNPLDLLKLSSDFIRQSGSSSESTTGSNSLNASQSRYATLLNQLETISARVEGQVKELERQKAQLLDDIRSASGVLTSSDAAYGTPQPKHAYDLRGVALSFRTRTPVIYLKTPQPPSSLASSATIDHSPEPHSQDNWWQLTYDYSTAAVRVDKTIVAESDVLRAASQFSSFNKLLIYANPDAMSPTHHDDSIAISLPPSLQAFVDRDNAAFNREFTIQATPIEAFPPGRRLSSGSTVVERATSPLLLGDSQEMMEVRYDDTNHPVPTFHRSESTVDLMQLDDDTPPEPLVRKGG